MNKRPSQACHECAAPVHYLAAFPAAPGKRGVRCLACYERAEANAPMPTAEQINAAFRRAVR